RHRRSRSSPSGAADRSACTRLAPRLPCRRACASPPEPFPHPEIDLGLRGGPVGGAVEPAPHHLGARPGIEDVLGRSREGPLDTHHAAELLAHRRTFRSSRYSPTRSQRPSPPPPVFADTFEEAFPAPRLVLYPIRSRGKRPGPQREPVGPPNDHAAHDTCLLQHSQVPRDGRLRNPEAACHLPDRRRSSAEALDDLAP